VREDYSNDGNAWAYFSHDQSRSRAYRWGEDGLGGISDSNSLLYFGLALWNGKEMYLLKNPLRSLHNHKKIYVYVSISISISILILLLGKNSCLLH
jgi:hypothetical protein